MATVDTTNGTYLKNLFDPQVIGEMINEKLTKNIVLSPLATIDYTLQGRAGSKVTLPFFSYIGDSEVVNEGEDIPIKQLTEKTKEVAIKKIGRAVQITDEAVLSGYGDPVNEAVRQLVTSIGSTVDNQLLDALDAITTGDGSDGYLYTPSSNFEISEFPKALAKFGEELDGPKVAIVTPDIYAQMLDVKSYIPASEIAANMVIQGSVGMVYGTQIIVSERIVSKDAIYVVKPGALAIFMKRDTLVETDRDILNQSTVIAASKLFAPYLYRPTSALKIKLSGE